MNNFQIPTGQHRYNQQIKNIVIPWALILKTNHSVHDKRLPTILWRENVLGRLYTKDKMKRICKNYLREVKIHDYILEVEKKHIDIFQRINLTVAILNKTSYCTNATKKYKNTVSSFLRSCHFLNSMDNPCIRTNFINLIITCNGWKTKSFDVSDFEFSFIVDSTRDLYKFTIIFRTTQIKEIKLPTELFAFFDKPFIVNICKSDELPVIETKIKLDDGQLKYVRQIIINCDDLQNLLIKNKKLPKSTSLIVEGIKHIRGIPNVLFGKKTQTSDSWYCTRNNTKYYSFHYT